MCSLATVSSALYVARKLSIAEKMLETFLPPDEKMLYVGEGGFPAAGLILEAAGLQQFVLALFDFRSSLADENFDLIECGRNPGPELLILFFNMYPELDLLYEIESAAHALQSDHAPAFSRPIFRDSNMPEAGHDCDVPVISVFYTREQ